jgi:outer membrane protein, multidrug efflux system
MGNVQSNRARLLLARCLLAALAITPLLTGCANFQKTKAATSTAVPAPAKWQATLPHDGSITDLKNWWQQFNDPLLVQLIESAQNVSADVATAKAQIVAAQSAVTTQDAASKPNVSLDANASRSQDSLLFPPKTNVGVGLNASWELDIWGKNKAAKSSEETQLTGKQALWHDARIIVAAETAKHYVNYRLCENLTMVAKKNAESTAETAHLSNLTVKAGFLASASASQAEAQASDAQNQLKKQQLQCVLLVKSLVALTAMPETDLQAALDKNSGVMPKPVGIAVDTVPANALVQRPDVLNAERNVAAASFEVISTQKARYPSLSLAGNVGWAYDTTSSLFSPNRKVKASDGFTWSIGPIAVSMPIFDAGLRRANLNAAKAQYTAAKSIYESVARNAVREVEENLATLNSAAMRLDDVNNAANGFKVSLDATQLRYAANLANLFELEEARRAHLQAQNNVLTLENERVQAWISLYRAIGGGWASANASNNSSANNGSKTLAEIEPKLMMDRLLQSLGTEPMPAEPAEMQLKPAAPKTEPDMPPEAVNK